MTSMNQPGMDKGLKGETGEKIPSGSRSSDTKGERKVGLTGGVGMGVKDGIPGRDGSHHGKFDGQVGEYNDGRMDGEHCYRHTKEEYPGSEKAGDRGK